MADGEQIYRGEVDAAIYENYKQLVREASLRKGLELGDPEINGRALYLARLSNEVGRAIVNNTQIIQGHEPEQIPGTNN